ncbi:hypothetical protein AX15_000587 [Amanita polypyramis BW_CC]|nr:hypothetical protein AX15_000587 [Amanita polypyramis BW_CC]
MPELTALPDVLNPDGKSLYNPPADRLSSAYDRFPPPISPSAAKNGFDFHVYYTPAELDHARSLHDRIRREFPELRIYRLRHRAVGPHPAPMFEVNTFTPHQTGALFSWLVVHRGSCSVLIHPNTGDPYKDHTELATWMGEPWALNSEKLRRGH